MSRVIDSLPNPSHVRPMKVLGLGPSRTGTLGLYQALKTLGYHPFHISELLPYGIQQMKALQEAIIASQSSNESGDKKKKNKKPFGRPEFDRMWGAYDCIIESPCYLGTNGVQVYLEDADVKFILTERSPESFAKSIAGSLGAYNAKFDKFPLSVAKYFDSFFWELSRLFRLMTFRWSHGLIEPTDPAFHEALVKSYVEYISTIKTIVPAERLLVLNLEKGFGWDEICQFLDCPVPDTPYPRSNSMSEFHVAAEMIISPKVTKIMTVLTSSAVATLGVGVWWWWRR